MGGEIILVIANQLGQHIARRADHPRPGVRPITALAGPGIDPDQPPIGGDINARRLQRFPDTLKKQPLLRVGNPRLLGVETKEISIKILDPVQHKAGLYIAGIG